jgi:hypothetical protein
MPLSVEKVEDGKDGMPEQHARTRITHHCPHLFTAILFITVDWTFGAGRFVGFEYAAIQTLKSVFE